MYILYFISANFYALQALQKGRSMAYFKKMCTFAALDIVLDTVPLGPFVLSALEDGRKVLSGADNPILHFGCRPYYIFLSYYNLPTL